MIDFSHSEALQALERVSDEELEALPFGVVGMTLDGTVDRYNRWESNLAGLSRDRVLGKSFFSEIALCTNNFMVSQRYWDEPALDERVPYVFTVKMRPRKVDLRLLKHPDFARMYLLVRDR